MRLTPLTRPLLLLWPPFPLVARRAQDCQLSDWEPMFPGTVCMNQAGGWAHSCARVGFYRNYPPNYPSDYELPSYGIMAMQVRLCRHCY